MLQIHLTNYLLKTKNKANTGFTLIELLVVIVIIGILSAIALPSFLSQASKARQSEAKQYVSSVNSAQKTFYLEEQQFADNWGDLALGIDRNTRNYEYALFDFGSNSKGVSATPKATNTKGYLGGVGAQESVMFEAICEARRPGKGISSTDIGEELVEKQRRIKCGEGMKRL